MLYATIQYVSAAIFLIFGRHTANGGYIEPNITLDQDIHCGDAYNDTCTINCALRFDETPWTVARIPNVYCGNTTKCIIHCSADFCLRDSYIHANHTTHIDLLSHGGNGCFQSSHLYLPNHGNATIIGDANGTNNNGTLNALQIYSGTHTNRVEITCNGATDCDALQIHAQTAQSLTITMNGSSFRNSTVFCPETSPLSPSCIINADRAQSTEYLHIYALKGMPQDVIFHSNEDAPITNIYTGTTITCLDGNHSSVIRNNSFIGTPCFLTLVPPTPTAEPTPQNIHIEMDLETTKDDNDSTDPPKGVIKFFLRVLSLEVLLFILVGLTLLAACCIIALYIANKKKKQQIEKVHSAKSRKSTDEWLQGAQIVKKNEKRVPQPMDHVIAEMKMKKINSNDVSEAEVTNEEPPLMYMDHVTRLPPPKPRVISQEDNIVQSVELVQNNDDNNKNNNNNGDTLQHTDKEEEEEVEDEEEDDGEIEIRFEEEEEEKNETRQAIEPETEEHKVGDSDSTYSDSDTEGGDTDADGDVVNIIVSSVQNNADHLERVASESVVQDVSEGLVHVDHESESENSQSYGKKEKTKGAPTKGMTDSESSFSSDSIKGGMTDIGDLVIGHGADDGEADDADLLVGEVGSF